MSGLNTGLVLLGLLSAVFFTPGVVVSVRAMEM